MHTDHRGSLRRRRLYAAGFCPLTVWAPNVRRPGFAEDCLRQSVGLWADPAEHEAIHAAEELSDWADR